MKMSEHRRIGTVRFLQSVARRWAIDSLLPQRGFTPQPRVAVLRLPWVKGERELPFYPVRVPQNVGQTVCR